MSLSEIRAGAPLGAGRGAVVVCVAADPSTSEPTRGANDSALVTVLAHTDPAIPVVACPDAGALTAAIEAAAPADIAIVAAGCRVGPGWLGPLARAANGDLAIATASPVVLAQADPASARPPDGIADVCPRLAAPDPACVYVRRAAIELAGGAVADERPTLDPSFAARCRRAGLGHVLAPRSLVGVVEGRGAAGDPPGGAAAARARRIARRSQRRPSVLVDARILSGPADGTRVHVLELLGGLARAGRARVTALVGHDLPGPMRDRLATLSDLELAVTGPGRPPTVHADVVHRPHQVAAPADLSLLAGCADRVVVTQQDLIGFHNPAYFPTEAGWQGYRELTAIALATADFALFPSDNARRDALAEDLVSPERSATIAHGVDHRVAHQAAAADAPAGATHLESAPETLLCLGTDLRHKNRLFALALAAELRAAHDWRGTLVLAGPRVAHGSSRPDEARMLAADPGLAAAVLELPAVSEPERRWLLEHSALVLYPTVQEGFGFVPFEAAEHGRPCLWAPDAAMSDVLDDAVAGIVPWNVGQSAARAAMLLRDRERRAGAVTAVREAATGLTWDATAAALLDVYAAVSAAPPSPGAVRERVAGLMRDGVSEDAMRLVGPGGLLPAEVERPLLALAARPRLARPAYGALRLGYRLSRRGR